MNGMDRFLGHEIKYWLELQKMAEEINATDFIQEIVELKGKISFYESRIEQMSHLLPQKAAIK